MKKPGRKLRFFAFGWQWHQWAPMWHLAGIYGHQRGRGMGRNGHRWAHKNAKNPAGTGLGWVQFGDGLEVVGLLPEMMGDEG